MSNRRSWRMPIASPIGSGRAISPIQLAGTSDLPEHAAPGIWNSASPRTQLDARAERRPAAADPRDRIARAAEGTSDRPARATTTRHGTTMASWTRGHVPIHSSVRRVATRVAARASAYAPSATRYGSQDDPRAAPDDRRPAPGRRARGGPRPATSACTGPPVSSAWSSERAAEDEVARGRPRGTTARCCPAAPAATSTSAVAAGTSGRRANTSAATAAIATENRTTLQPSTQRRAGTRAPPR